MKLNKKKRLIEKEKTKQNTSPLNSALWGGI
jgi:hypothetical protein